MGKYSCPWGAPTSATRARVLAHATQPQPGTAALREKFMITLGIGGYRGRMGQRLEALVVEDARFEIVARYDLEHGASRIWPHW